MADLEELVVRIRADSAHLEQAMRRAQGVVQQSSNGMSGALKNVVDQAKALAPALSVAAVVAFTRSAINAADHLNDLALRTGVAGSTFSALNIKLLQSGSSVDDLAQSINRMNNIIGEAAKGTSKEAVKAFDDLGLSVKKLAALSPEDQFFEITAALGAMDNQGKQTNLGIAIFGRSFANLLPLLKETKGELREYTEEQKKLGNALSDAELARIDEFGDRLTGAWERAKLAVVDYLLFFEDMGRKHRRFLEDFSLPDNASFTRPNVPSDEQLAKGVRKSLGMPDPSARGSNAGLLQAESIRKARDELDKFNLELSRQHEFAGMAPRDAAAMKAYYDTLALAQKAGVKDAEALANANAQVARSTYDLSEAQAEAARFSAELKDQFVEMAGGIVTGSKSAADAVRGLADALAQMVAKKYILGPLADSLFGAAGGGGGILSGLFTGKFNQVTTPGPLPWLQSFDVGTDYVPRDMTANIHKGEMIIPAREAAAMRSGGGRQIVQHLNFNISPGVQGTVRQELMAAIPHIVNASKEATFAAIQRGGNEARLVGRRN